VPRPCAAESPSSCSPPLLCCDPKVQFVSINRGTDWATTRASSTTPRRHGATPLRWKPGTDCCSTLELQ
jgi:hypothetical protein